MNRCHSLRLLCWLHFGSDSKIKSRALHHFWGRSSKRKFFSVWRCKFFSFRAVFGKELKSEIFNEFSVGSRAAFPFERIKLDSRAHVRHAEHSSRVETSTKRSQKVPTVSRWWINIWRLNAWRQLPDKHHPKCVFGHSSVFSVVSGEDLITILNDGRCKWRCNETASFGKCFTIDECCGFWSVVRLIYCDSLGQVWCGNTAHVEWIKKILKQIYKSLGSKLQRFDDFLLF